MFLSMNWISDFVDFTGLDKLQLIHQFSLSTAEVENEIVDAPAFYKVKFDWLTFAPNLIVCLVLLAYFAIGLSYIYAAINIYFQDLERIMMLIMQMWMFATPIFIPETSIPLKYHWIYKVNPMAGIVQIWRDVFYAPGFHPQNWWYLGLISFAIFFFGRWIFNHMQNRFAEMM